MNTQDVLAKWDQEQLARSLVYKHLEAVTPSLTQEFQKFYPCISNKVPDKLTLKESLSNYLKVKITEVRAGKETTEKKAWGKTDSIH